MTAMAALVVVLSGLQVPAVAIAGPGTHARAARAENPRAASVAVRAPAPPVIDGRDDDAVWAQVPATTAFRQFQPKEDADPSFRTEFKVAYDDDHLYVFMRAYDPHPDSIMHALTRRDMRGPSDQLKVMIDPYDDHRSGYEFAVNPDGVKRDFSMFDDGNEDDSWTGVWDVATRVDSLGWTAEFRIPFSQLRYAAGSAHTFGFGVWRDLERFKERDSWPLYRPTRTGLSSQLGELDGIGTIGSPKPLELAPYIVAKALNQSTSTGYAQIGRATMGADLKYGLSPNVTLNATVNPDFGQVESDPAVLNLSSFETFLHERRPFFVEGTGVYNFAINCDAVHDCGSESLFYSRRIGRAPQLSYLYGDAASPQATRILGASKLTCRTPGGLNFGVLEAVTDHITSADSRTLEPMTSYAVVRAKQDLRKGQSGIGFIATAVNRSLDGWSADSLRRAAYVGGIDFRHRFYKGQYQVAGSLTASRLLGSAAAIASTQRDAVHNFQRPDAHLELDPTRTSLSGTAQEIMFGKYGGGLTRFEASYERQSAGYDINDLGYLRRADHQAWNVWAALNFNNPRWFYKTFRWNVNQWDAWTGSGLRMENAYNTNVHFNFKNNWWLHTGGTLGQLGDVYCDRCARGGPALRMSRYLSPWLGIQGDDRRRLVPGIWINYNLGDGKRSHFLDVNPTVDVHVSTRFEANLGLDFSRNIDDSQWYGNFSDSAGTHYAFAHLNQRTLSLTAQLDYTVTPELTVQFYGQPFVSTGVYSNVRQLSATPRAAAYDERFQPFTPPAGSTEGFENWQLASNTVVRWEYRPGSTIFLVWSHNRNGSSSLASTRSWGAEYNDLFALHPANTLLIKVAYWLNH